MNLILVVQLFVGHYTSNVEAELCRKLISRNKSTFKRHGPIHLGQASKLTLLFSAALAIPSHFSIPYCNHPPYLAIYVARIGKTGSQGNRRAIAGHHHMMRTPIHGETTFRVVVCRVAAGLSRSHGCWDQGSHCECH